jgi:hypothetical protein
LKSPIFVAISVTICYPAQAGSKFDLRANEKGAGPRRRGFFAFYAFSNF